MDLSVVIPVQNEAENVSPLFEEIRAALDGLVAYEVIFVDDGSSDETVANLLASGKRAPAPDAGFHELRIIRHIRRYGQSAGIHTGVAHARGAWIATLDGDGQNDPGDIPALWAAKTEVAAARPNLAMFAGLRAKRKDAWVKRVSSRIANRVRSTILRDDTSDTGCGLKLFRRDVFLALPNFRHMHRFLPALVKRQGYEIVSVPVNHRYRTAGSSKYTTLNRLWVGIVDLFGVWWLQRRANIPEILHGDDAEAS